ncbi:type II toxin-antitoxin system HicB family antitoxin [Desulfamplus magnetovallimortis]|nr:type II toxin-antitoxin system HicB family antitoxin [Desulfamplus magnetovallimortis]
MKIIYQKRGQWFTGHILEDPEYESQCETLEELRNNLTEIYSDIVSGLVPKA